MSTATSSENLCVGGGRNVSIRRRMAGNREVLRVVQILEEIDVKCMVFCPFLDIINCTY